jgi:hypothetical protein
MSRLSHEERLANAAKRRLVAEGRAQEVEPRIADEEKRQAANAAKTAKLRALREARDAAEHATTKAPPKASEKTRVLRPGVRLRKGKK